MGRCKPLGSPNSSLSHAPQLSGAKSCFLVHLKEEGQMWQMAASCIPHPSFPPSPSSSAITVEDGSIWITGTVFQFGSPHSHLEAENRWWLWLFLFIDMAGDIFISCQLSFIGGRMRTIAWETAPQIALRNCSKGVGGRSMYMYVIFMRGEYIQSSTEFFTEDFC